MSKAVFALVLQLGVFKDMAGGLGVHEDMIDWFRAPDRSAGFVDDALIGDDPVADIEAHFLVDSKVKKLARLLGPSARRAKDVIDKMKAWFGHLVASDKEKKVRRCVGVEESGAWSFKTLPADNGGECPDDARFLIVQLGSGTGSGKINYFIVHYDSAKVLSCEPLKGNGPMDCRLSSPNIDGFSGVYRNAFEFKSEQGLMQFGDGGDNY